MAAIFIGGGALAGAGTGFLTSGGSNAYTGEDWPNGYKLHFCKHSDNLFIGVDFFAW
jgi:hypothetical protein